MSEQSTAHDLREHRASRTEPRDVTLPMRFLGRAKLTLDLETLSRRLTIQLRDAARRDAITEDRVRDYCAARAIPHHRFEVAVLNEAFKVVSVDRLIERLVGHFRTRVSPELVRSYVCTAEQHDGHIFLRMGTEARGEPVLAVAADDPSWASAPGAAAATGTLSLDGSLLATGGHSFRIDIGWDVEKGMPCAAFGAVAGAYFAPPARAVVGGIAADALARFGDELPVHVASGLADAGDPTFVNVERLLRLGRLTHSTRVYLLYWKRLRDYLIWSITG